MGKAKQDRRILAEDGELSEVMGNDAAEEMIFCTHCGSMNRGIATYCRNCGQELQAQEVDPALAMGHPAADKGRKTKGISVSLPKAATAARENKMTVEGMFVELFTLIAVIVLSIISAAAGAPGMIIPVLIAWFLVVAARNGALN